MKSIKTVGFYNVENLFDTQDHPLKNDKAYTWRSRRRWTFQRYENKIEKIGYAISQIGKKETGNFPALVGLAEVENKAVLKDLQQSKALRQSPYEFVHFESKDERGIDVALLYQPEEFELLHAEPIESPLVYKQGKPDYTRDVLYVKGRLQGQLLHLFVAHLPSRREADVNLPFRKQIVQQLREKATELLQQDITAKIIMMGDFNENPNALWLQKELSLKSDKTALSTADFYHPMLSLSKEKQGTLLYRKRWYLFDQMLFSASFFESSSRLQYEQVDIFSPDFLRNTSKFSKGSPYRTYIGNHYLGGYSDHFPVYARLKIEL